MKKLISIILVVSFITSSFLCYASNNFYNCKSNYFYNDIQKTNSLCKQYNIRTTTKIPKHIKPIKINNYKELKNFISIINKPHYNYMANAYSVSNNIYSANGYATKRYWEGPPFEWFCIRAQYKYAYDKSRKYNYYTQVRAVEGYMSGTKLFADYTPNKSLTYGEISGDKLSLVAHTEGTLHYYLAIKNIIKVYDMHDVREHIFKNP